MLIPIIGIIVIASLAIVGCTLLPRCGIWSKVENPDRGLAIFATCSAFAILFQQTTQFKYTFMWVFNTDSAREAINESWAKSAAIGVWEPIMNVAYWLLIAAGVLALVAVIRGSIRESNESKLKGDSKEITSLLKEIRDSLKKLGG